MPEIMGNFDQQDYNGEDNDSNNIKDIFQVDSDIQGQKQTVYIKKVLNMEKKDIDRIIDPVDLINYEENIKAISNMNNIKPAENLSLMNETIQAVEDFPNEIKLNHKTALKLIKDLDGYVIEKFLTHIDINDTILLLKTIKLNHKVYAFLPENLRNNKSFTIDTIKNNKDIIYFLPNDFLLDNDIIIFADPTSLLSTLSNKIDWGEIDYKDLNPNLKNLYDNTTIINNEDGTFDYDFSKVTNDN